MGSLEVANLADSEVNLIKATMTELSYQGMKTKLQNIFSDITKLTCKSEPSIKVEGTYYTSELEETHYLNRGKQRGRNRGRNYNRSGFNIRGQSSQMNRYNSRRQTKSHMEGAINKQRTRSLNPPDESGQPSRCAICESIFHWARNCPHAYENQSKPFHTNAEEKKSDNEMPYVPLFLKP